MANLDSILKSRDSACFGSTYTKIGRIQRRLAWPLFKDNMQILKRSIFLEYYSYFWNMPKKDRKWVICSDIVELKRVVQKIKSRRIKNIAY